MTDSQHFLVDPQDVADRLLTLRGDERHHCLHALRKRTGDGFFCVDGLGKEYEVRLLSDDGREATCEILHTRERPRELPRDIILVQALIKKDRMEWLVEKAVELGVSRICPVITSRTDISAKTWSVERMEKIAVSALKQSRRSVRVRLEEVWPFAKRMTTITPGYICHESADRSLTSVEIPNLGSLAVAIGPEGGWSNEELETAKGWAPVSLGKQRLRAETAALAAITRIASALEG